MTSLLEQLFGKHGEQAPLLEVYPAETLRGCTVLECGIFGGCKDIGVINTIEEDGVTAHFLDAEGNSIFAIYEGLASWEPKGADIVSVWNLGMSGNYRIIGIPEKPA